MDLASPPYTGPKSLIRFSPQKKKVETGWDFPSARKSSNVTTEKSPYAAAFNPERAEPYSKSLFLQPWGLTFRSQRPLPSPVPPEPVGRPDVLSCFAANGFGANSRSKLRQQNLVLRNYFWRNCSRNLAPLS